MKKIYEMRLLMYSVGLFISYALERLISGFIVTKIGDNTVLVNFISVIILLVLFVVTNILLKILIGSRFMARMAFGDKYVGGRWIEFVYNEQAEITGFCDIDIIYSEDKIFMSGTNYDKNFKTQNSFETQNVAMENFDLSYVFIQRDGKKFIQGLGHLNFHRNSTAPPKRYSGDFVIGTTRFIAEGVAVKDKAVIKNLDNSFIHTVTEILAQLQAEATAELM